MVDPATSEGQTRDAAPEQPAQQPQVPERAERPQHQEVADIQGSTRAGISSIDAQRLKGAGTYQEKTLLIDRYLPPIQSDVAMELLRAIDPSQEQGLLDKVLAKMENGIDPELTIKDDKTIFATTLMTPERQLRLVKMLLSDGLEKQVVKLLQTASSEEVRLAVMKKMRAQFASEQDVLEAAKTTIDWKVVNVILDRVPKGGLSAEMVVQISDLLKTKPGVFQRVRAKLHTWDQAQVNHQKSGPEKLADDVVVNPTKSFFGWLGNLGGKVKGFFKSLWPFGNKEPEAPAAPPDAQIPTPPPAGPQEPQGQN